MKWIFFEVGDDKELAKNILKSKKLSLMDILYFKYIFIRKYGYKTIEVYKGIVNG